MTNPMGPDGTQRRAARPMIDNMCEVRGTDYYEGTEANNSDVQNSRHVKTTWDWELRVTSASGSKDHPY